MMKDEVMLGRLLSREGGWADNPVDRGGPTKFGIILQTYKRWLRKEGLNATDIAAKRLLRSLSREEAKKIYRVYYIEKYRLDNINDERLREHVLDCVVLHGGIGIKWLQKGVGVKPDGIFGPKTEAAVNSTMAETTSRFIFKQRMMFIVKPVVRRPAQLQFLKGWTARAMLFI